jgi:hypothetical protein
MKSTILLLAVFFVSCLVVMPSIPSASTTPTPRPDRGLFHLQFLILVMWSGNETSIPINPGDTRQFHLNISSTITRGAYGQLLLDLLAGHHFVIHAKIDNVTSWATATLSSETLDSVITSPPGVFYTIPDTLTIHVNPDAPHYNLGIVLLNFSANNYRGPFGHWTLIGGYDHIFTFDFGSG